MVVEATDLSGTWSAASATDHLRRHFAAPSYSIEAEPEDTWHEVKVPGHWRDHGPFADADGPLLYRRDFELGALAAGRRSWLVLDGVYYGSDIWLDDEYVGSTEGYFAPHAFEISDFVQKAGGHVLGLEVFAEAAQRFEVHAPQEQRLVAEDGSEAMPEPGAPADEAMQGMP